MIKNSIQELVRPNVKNMRPYASARHEFTGEAAVFLDANENPFADGEYGINRYPAPQQQLLKERISALKGIPAGNIFLGNGSDEVIDLALRIFCEPGIDNILICPPTYGMYEVAAQLNNVAVKKVPLTADFQLDIPAIREAINAQTKMLFVCSPNNPSGNSLRREDIEDLLSFFTGILVVDEAYIDFSGQESFASVIADFPRLLVLQTLSKAWGMAGLRIGMGFASEELIGLLNKVKPPYNINSVSQQIALEKLQDAGQEQQVVQTILQQRERLVEALGSFSFVEKLYPSDANFLLIKCTDANQLYRYLLQQGIVTRNRSQEPDCENCLRISIGTPAENEQLLLALSAFQGEAAPVAAADSTGVKKQRLTLTDTRKTALPPRFVQHDRITKETSVSIQLLLDGSGNSNIKTGLHFFDHMLDQLARHSGVDIDLACDGDLQVDEHHTIEDVGITLGEAFAKALGDKRGIERYGFMLPMDDCLARVALDFGGRNWLVWKVKFKREKLGDVPTEMFEHFFKSFSDAARCNLNIKASGKNEHHKIESIFKAFAKSIKMAVTRQPGNLQLPSTKGII